MDKEIDEGVIEIMQNNDLDLETAVEVRNLMDELGVDEDDAIEIQESL